MRLIMSIYISLQIFRTPLAQSPKSQVLDSSLLVDEGADGVTVGVQNAAGGWSKETVQPRATASCSPTTRGRWPVDSARRAVPLQGWPSSRRRSRTPPSRTCCATTGCRSRGWPPANTSTPGSGLTVRSPPPTIKY